MTIATRHGGLQIVYAGKAHPQDEAGKEPIRRIFRARDLLRDKIKIAYLSKLQYGNRQNDDCRSRCLAQHTAATAMIGGNTCSPIRWSDRPTGHTFDAFLDPPTIEHTQARHAVYRRLHTARAGGFHRRRGFAL